MIAAAERLTPVLLELGGKDPMIVSDDADLAKAAEAAVFGALTNRGPGVHLGRTHLRRRCGVHDPFVAEVVESSARAQGRR